MKLEADVHENMTDKLLMMKMPTMLKMTCDLFGMLDTSHQEKHFAM